MELEPPGAGGGEGTDVARLTAAPLGDRSAVGAGVPEAGGIYVTLFLT